MSRLRIVALSVAATLLLAGTSGVQSTSRAASPSPSSRSAAASGAGSGWSEQTAPESADWLTVVSAVDENVVWAGGRLATLIRTTDGGENWEGASGGGTFFVWAMYAMSDLECHMGTGFGIISRTIDGGAHWIHTWDEGGNSPIRWIHFCDAQNGWALQDPIDEVWQLLETTNGGISWFRSPGAPPASGTVTGVYDSFGWTSDCQFGIFGTSNPEIMRTSNSGASWEPRDIGFAGADVALSPNGIGLAGGANFMLKRSTDSGASWGSIPSPNWYIFDFDFIDDSEVWALSGPNGSQTDFFEHSTDGGQSWTGTPVANVILFHLDFINANYGWAVGGLQGQLGNARIFKYSAYKVDVNPTGPTTQIGGADEIVSFSGEILNDGAFDDVYDISVSGVPLGWTLSYTTPAGTFSGPSTLAVTSGAVAAFTLDLDSQGLGGTATVTLQVDSQNEPSSNGSIDFTKINGVQVLLVDDDGGATREDFFIPSIEAAGVSWARWDREAGSLTTTDLQNAALTIVWMCGIESPSLDVDDRTALGGYLEGFGKLFLSGADVSYDLANPASPNHSQQSEDWHDDYLHAVHGTGNASSWSILGTPGHPIGNGLSSPLSMAGDNRQVTPDGISPGAGADLVFTYEGSVHDAGVSWTNGQATTVFFSFGFEGITDAAVRDAVMERIIGSFIGVDSPQPAAPILSLAQNAPNPFRPSTSISFELHQAGLVRLQIFDVGGRAVRRLLDGHRSGALHTVEWDARDDAGRRVPGGVYFYELVAPGGVVETRRMVLAP